MSCSLTFRGFVLYLFSKRFSVFQLFLLCGEILEGISCLHQHSTRTMGTYWAGGWNRYHSIVTLTLFVLDVPWWMIGRLHLKEITVQICVVPIIWEYNDFCSNNNGSWFLLHTYEYQPSHLMSKIFVAMLVCATGLYASETATVMQHKQRLLNYVYLVGW